jgi:hypothetical protein
MRAKRKWQRRVIALSRHSDVYEPVDKLRPRNLVVYTELYKHWRDRETDG